MPSKKLQVVKWKKKKDVDYHQGTTHDDEFFIYPVPISEDTERPYTKGKIKYFRVCYYADDAYNNPKPILTALPAYYHSLNAAKFAVECLAVYNANKEFILQMQS